MTKDEFLTMVNSELENLESEYKKTSQAVDFYTEIDSIGEEFQAAAHRLKVLQQKIRYIKSIVNLPAYARIQAMSDIEIEEYKKDKIEELELKYNEIKAKEDQNKAKSSQLKAKQEEMMEQFGILSGDEREIAIAKGKKLVHEIKQNDADLISIQGEMQAIRNEQEQIKNRTSQEIKENLSATIRRRDMLDAILSDKSDPSAGLLASVSSDLEKSKQMANLLTEYRHFVDSQSNISYSLFLPISLPITLSEKIKYLNPHIYNSYSQELGDPDELMRIVEQFEENYDLQNYILISQLSKKKLSKLVDYKDGIYIREDIERGEVDIDFLQQHSDKIGDGKLKHLESIVAQRDKLCKKIFKTQKVKSDIDGLNYKIKQEQSAIYKEIKGWYSMQGLSSTSFSDQDMLENQISSWIEKVSQEKDAIRELKKDILGTKANKDKLHQDYEAKKSDIAQQIRALAGSKFEKVNIPSALDTTDANLGNIAGASGWILRDEVINRVQQEAQNQANIRENELRKMLEQAYSQTDNIEILDESKKL